MGPRSYLLLFAALVACKDSPSFRVRWNLVDRDGERLDVTRATDCSSMGINEVRVSAIDALGDVEDERVFPCFAPGFEDPDATVGGPELPAGPYAIEVRGVQRDGEPWRTGPANGDANPRCDPNIPRAACQAVDIACDCELIDVRDEVTELLSTKVLVAPVECIDGIDNDHDGLVDAQDPACQQDTVDAREGDSVSVVQFRAIVTVFGNEAMDCDDVGLTTIRARACPYVGDVPCTADDGTLAAGTVELASVGCRTGEPLFFDQRLGVGSYTVELTGLGGTTVLTRPQLAPVVEVQDFVPGSFVAIEVDFGVEDFLAPVHESATFAVLYDQGAGLGSLRGCSPAPSRGFGTLALADVVLEVRDAHGGPLATPVSAVSPDVFPLDGTPIACLDQPVRTESIDWGGYTLRVQARAADGTVCFTTDGQAGAPDAPLSIFPGAIGLAVPRVLENGRPPASCSDCVDADDCDGNACVDSLCQR